MSRLCGYCRMDGHRADNCHIKQEVRQKVLSYTPKERKWTLEYMVKQGFGEGCTIFYSSHLNSELGNMCVITNADFVEKWDFGAFKKVKYSKQVRFTPMSYISRSSDNVVHNKYQYDIIPINSICFTGGLVEMRHLRLRADWVVNPDRDADTLLTQTHNRIVLVDPSYKMFDVPDSLYTDKVLIHKRVAGPTAERVNSYSDYYHEKGFLS